MRPGLLALIITLVAGSAMAQAGDPLASADCRKALEALRVQEDKALTGRAASAPAEVPGHGQKLNELEPLRRHAARACLGARGEASPQPRRFPHSPLAAPPVTIPLPAVPSA